MAYCAPQDVYDLGLSAQAFSAQPRRVEAVYPAVLPAVGVFEITGHGYHAADQLLARVLGAFGGSTVPGTSASSTPLAVPLGTLLYPVPISTDLFSLALTSSGTPITIADAGSGEWGLKLDPLRKLLRIIADEATRIDECLTAHFPPIKVDPITGLYNGMPLLGLNARMAARAAITAFGLGNVKSEEFESTAAGLDRSRAADDAMLADWKAGRPIAARPPDQDDIPDNAPRMTNRYTAIPPVVNNWRGSGAL